VAGIESLTGLFVVFQGAPRAGAHVWDMWHYNAPSQLNEDYNTFFVKMGEFLLTTTGFFCFSGE
jgi:hypothetical protein